MGIEAAMASQMTITLPPLRCSTPKLRRLTLSLPTSWNCAHRVQHCNLTLTTAIALSSDVKTDKSSRRLARKEGDPKRLSSSASQRVALDYYQIIQCPLITDLTMKQMIENNTLTFVVDKRADKENIKAAAKKVFKIETRKVNTMMVPGGSKKAYLMLKPEHNALEIAKELRII